MRFYLLVSTAHVQPHFFPRPSNLFIIHNLFIFSEKFFEKFLTDLNNTGTWCTLTSARRFLNDSALVVSDTTASPARLVFSSLDASKSKLAAVNLPGEQVMEYVRLVTEVFL